MKKGNSLLLMSGILVFGGVAINAVINKSIRKDIDKYKELSDKHLSLFLLMNQWIKIKQEGKYLQSFFNEKGYKKIAIYGMSYVGETLLNELRETNVCIAYGIDKRTEGFYTDLDILSIEDSIENVDAIIVTAVTFFDEIKEKLEKKVTCPIISLEDILYAI